MKQYENILNQKLININDLRSLSWKGIPFGNISFIKEKYHH